MRTNQLLAPSFVALGLALASTGANAQAVTSRSVTVEPVETTVTQTPGGTVVTRRPVEAPAVGAQAVETQVVRRGPAIVESDPGSIESVTTREVVERAAVTEAMRPPRRTTTQQASSRPTVRRDTPPSSQATRQVVRRTTTTTRAAPRLALDSRERHIIYQTVVERQVVPRQQVVVAPPVLAEPPLIQRPVALPAIRPPIVAADEQEIVRPAAPIYAVGSVLPPNVPLYAVPQNVALSVPAAGSYSYAYLGGRAYLVDPASSTVVADVTE